MPLVQPQTWDKAYNPWLFSKAKEFWNKLPSDVRSNLKFMSDAPTPGLPIGAADDIVTGGIKGAVAIPAMLANPKTRTFLKKMMSGLDLGEAVPAVRNQQENYPFAFTQWIKDRIPRNALFFSPGGHKFSYDEMAEGAAEGGPHRVEWLQKLKNPLVIKRDETGFLAEHVLRTLLGSQSVKQGNKYVSVPNKEGKELLRSISQATYPGFMMGSDKRAAMDKLLNYIEPQQLESSLVARDPKTALGEAIASELARKAGYDSIISTRPKIVISASQRMANEATMDRLARQENYFWDLHSPWNTSQDDFGSWVTGWDEVDKLRNTKDFLNRIERKRGPEFVEKLQIEAQKRLDAPVKKDTTGVESRVKVSKLAETLRNKVSKRGAKTELLPTQVMLIDKPWLKEMRQKGKDYLNPPKTKLGSYAQSIVNFFKSGQMQSDALPDVIKFNLEQGTIAPEEIQMIQQAIKQ